MAVSKIFELANELSLSGQHMNVYFQNRRWEAECLPLVDRDPKELTRWLPFVQDGALAIRFDSDLAATVLAQFPRLPTHVNWLGTADTLLREEQQWWPRLMLYDVLRKVMIQQFPELDTSLCAYIVGATHKGRAAAAAVAALGFSKIRFIDIGGGALEEELQLLRRYLFGVDISSVSGDALTMETIPGSLMFNTIRLQDHSTVTKDLSYFNFMKHGGAVIDASDCTDHAPFLDEAVSANLKTLSGLQFQSFWDVELLQKLFPGQYMTHEDYFESFSEHVALSKNQPSV